MLYTREVFSADSALMCKLSGTVFIEQLFWQNLTSKLSFFKLSLVSNEANLTSFVRSTSMYRLGCANNDYFLVFFNLLLRINTLVHVFFEFSFAAQEIFLTFLKNLLSATINDIVLVFIGALNLKHPFNADVLWREKSRLISNFFLNRFLSYLIIRRLNAASFTSLLISSIRNLVKSVWSRFGDSPVIPHVEYTKHLHLYSYKFNRLSKLILWNSANSSINFIFAKDVIKLNEFLLSYTRRPRMRYLRFRTTVKRFYVKRKKFKYFKGRKQKKFYRHKFGLKSEADLLKGDQPLRLIRRRWWRVKKYFKALVDRTQFSFLFFWSFNFFNVLRLNLSSSKFFFVNTRLIYFFKFFLKFFKFYTVYSSFIRAGGVNNFLLLTGNKSVFFVNFKVYLWLLFNKFKHVLISFRSVCLKLFNLRWQSVDLHKLNGNFLLFRNQYFKRGVRPILVTKLAGITSKLKLLPRSAALGLVLMQYKSFLASKLALKIVDSRKKWIFRRYLKFLFQLRARYIKIHLKRFKRVFKKLRVVDVRAARVIRKRRARVARARRKTRGNIGVVVARRLRSWYMNKNVAWKRGWFAPWSDLAFSKGWLRAHNLLKLPRFLKDFRRKVYLRRRIEKIFSARFSTLLSVLGVRRFYLMAIEAEFKQRLLRLKLEATQIPEYTSLISRYVSYLKWVEHCSHWNHAGKRRKVLQEILMLFSQVQFPRQQLILHLTSSRGKLNLLRHKSGVLRLRKFKYNEKKRAHVLRLFFLHKKLSSARWWNFSFSFKQSKRLANLTNNILITWPCLYASDYFRQFLPEFPDFFYPKPALTPSFGVLGRHLWSTSRFLKTGQYYFCG